MTRILLTCPPMRGLVEEFLPRFEAAGVDLTLPPMVQTMTEDELVAILPDYDGWIAGDDPATGRVMQAGMTGKLRAMVKWGVGVDNVDFAAAEALGLPVQHTPAVFGNEVADVAIGYIAGLARQLFFIDREIRANATWPKPSGTSLHTQHAALIGCGDIGRQVARRMLACGMRVTVYDPAYAATADLDLPSRTWPEGVGEADFLVFTAPLNQHTRHMLDAATLAMTKPGVRIVNVGRGPVIDEAALIAGLRSGHVHSAALDVFEDEPLPADSPLRDFPLCILGSHNGSNTREAVIRVSHVAIGKMFALLGVEEAR